MTTKNAIAVAGALLLALTACGDDLPEVKQKRPAARRGAAAKTPAGAKAKAKGPPLKTYAKIPDKLRRTFLEKDFRPDPTGDANRDPFRSYIVRQPGLGETRTDDDASAADDICRNDKRRKNWQAPNFSLRDLKLLGIIMRGTRGYAQFVDTGGEGWIVTQGNCLGVEKAIVTSIGSGVVRLQVRPQAPLGGTAPPPVNRDIPLYPEEYDITTSDQSR